MHHPILVDPLLIAAAGTVLALGSIAALLARRERASYAQTPATVVYAPAPTPVAHYFVPDPPVLPTVEPAVNVRFKTEEIDHMQADLDDDYENAVTKISVSPKASLRPIDMPPADELMLSNYLEPRGHVHAMPRGRTPRATEPEPTSPFRLETRADEPSVITSAPRPDRR